ncbi:amidohydrolase [Actinoplanes sp. NBC_00393]|uniref:amidohydrolase family protein n=1 Tax=Actinoplanes sp. NBC_00393 TaxID=2975953 RepID=UPI002E1CCCFE
MTTAGEGEAAPRRVSAGCCGGSSSGGGCGGSAARLAACAPGAAPAADAASTTDAAPAARATKTAGAAPAARATKTAGAGPAAGRIGWLLADSVWWGGRLRSGVALRVAPDGVVKPVPAELAPAGPDTRRLPGTLLPGLVDAHVHSALVDLGTVRAGGIAAVWDLGGVPAAVRELAERARSQHGPVAADARSQRPASADARSRRPASADAQSQRPAAADRTPYPAVKLPRIRYAGPFLIAPGGYPSDREWAAAGSWREIGSAADAGAAVADAWSGGAGLIKVTAHTGGPQLPQPVLRALVDAAHASGLPVVVHAEGPGTVAAAYTAGADLLAHTPWTERLDDALVRACAARMCWISTLDIHGWGEPDPAREIAIDNLRRFREHGGSVRYGTDLGNGPLPPGINVREIRALQAAGLTPDDVLSVMTDSDSITEVSWVAGGLDLDPERFADVLATARVVDADVRPA